MQAELSTRASARFYTRLPVIAISILELVTCSLNFAQMICKSIPLSPDGQQRAHNRQCTH